MDCCHLGRADQARRAGYTSAPQNCRAIDHICLVIAKSRTRPLYEPFVFRMRGLPVQLIAVHHIVARGIVVRAGRHTVAQRLD
jgi:hypothetical protein